MISTEPAWRTDTSIRSQYLLQVGSKSCILHHQLCVQSCSSSYLLQVGSTSCSIYSHNQLCYITVYIKTYHLMENGNDVFLRMITYARICIMPVYAIILYMSIYLSLYCALPRTEWIFLVFEGSFFEVPRVVLFHGTAIHCHYSTDIEDTSFFILEWVTDLPRIHSAWKDREMDERVELSQRKYSRRRVGSYNLASLVAKV